MTRAAGQVARVQNGAPLPASGETAGGLDVRAAQRVDRGILEAGEARRNELVRRSAALRATRVLGECPAVQGEGHGAAQARIRKRSAARVEHE